MKALLLPALKFTVLLTQMYVATADEASSIDEFISLYREASIETAQSDDLIYLTKEFKDLTRSGQVKIQVNRLSDDDLKLLTLAFEDLIRLSDVEGASYWLTMAVKELHKRGRALEYHYRSAFNGLISDRKFGEAQDFRKKLSLKRLPEVPRAHFIEDEPKDPKQRFWKVDPGRRVLNQHQFEFVGPQVIVVTHPAVCAPSRRAMEAFYDDVQFRTVMEKDGLLLVPAFFGLHFDYIQDWNKKHPENSLVIAHSSRDWPMLDLTITPGFYFFIDNTLIHHVLGWPQEGNREAVLDGLKAIGLIEHHKDESR